MTNTGSQKLVFAGGILLGFAYAAAKFDSVAGLWFDGIAAYSKLFRAYLDWGTGAELFGSLLPVKWIGTRTVTYGMALFAITCYSIFVGRYWILAVFLLEGALLEALDIVWLLYGELAVGWSTHATHGAEVTSAIWCVVLLATGIALLQTKGSDEPSLPYETSENKFARRFLYWCYFVALVFAGMKLVFAYLWWFEGRWFWAQGFRFYPEWGTPAEEFGALMAAKWIGSRNFAYGLMILLGVLWSWRRGTHRLLGFLLLQGTLIEFFDGFWLANGKFNNGWVGLNTEFFMYGGFIWTPFELSCAVFLLTREARPRQRSALTSTAEQASPASARTRPERGR